MLQKERENIMRNNNYVCSSTSELGVGPCKGLLLCSSHCNSLLLEGYLEARLTFPAIEVVEQREECTASLSLLLGPRD